MAASPESILQHVLPDIEKYLDFMSHVHLSETCRTFQDALVKVVHAPSSHSLMPLYSSERNSPTTFHHKLRVSNFTFQDKSLPRQRNNNGLDLSYLALTKLHFGSLKRLEIQFPFSNSRQFSYDLHYMMPTFTCFVENIGEASNLDELSIFLGSMITHDHIFSASITNTGAETVYDCLANNLTRCKKLRNFKLFNSFLVPNGGLSFHNVDEYFFVKHNRFPHYGLGFLHALIPMIQQHVLAGKYSTLEGITLSFGNTPMPPPMVILPDGMALAPEGRSYPNWTETAERDFFVSVLQLPNLKQLNVQMDLASGPLLNNFLLAAEHVYEKLGSIPSQGVLEQFTVSGVLYTMPEGKPHPLPDPCSLSSCLALVATCFNLSLFMVRLPPACWDDRAILALGNVLSNKPKLHSLGLYFQKYPCYSESTAGKCLLEYILNYLEGRENKPKSTISISGVKFMDDEVAEKWEESLEVYHVNGKGCWSESDEYDMRFQVNKGQLMRWETIDGEML